MEFKNVSGLELRAGSDGEIEGYASTFTPRADSYGDVILPGAFKKAIASGRKIKLLWQHRMDEPIGIPMELREDSKGLFGRWRLVGTDTGKKARELVREGLVDGLSIGFIDAGSEIRSDGLRYLYEVDLHEVSVVTIPARDDALITGWKSKQRPHQRGRLTLELAELELDQQRRKSRYRGVSPSGPATLAQMEQDLRRRRLLNMGVKV